MEYGIAMTTLEHVQGMCFEASSSTAPRRTTRGSWCRAEVRRPVARSDTLVDEDLGQRAVAPARPRTKRELWA